MRNLMTELRLCKDCKWYKKSWVEHLIFGSDTYDKCLHPVLSGNLVTGKARGDRCIFRRMYGGGCREEGKYWEARK